MKLSAKDLSILAISLMSVSSLSAKTRWSTNRTIPDADFIGSGELIIGYDGFLNSNKDNDLFMTSQLPISMGFGEWLTVSTGWSDGVTAGFKARLLNESTSKMPSMAIGIRNLYNNSTLTRARVDNDDPQFTGELFLAMSQGFDAITMRLHGGLLSIPYSDTEQFNGFFGVEKYFGGSFYATFEGFSFYDRLTMSLFGTLRFMKNDRAELYAGMIDLERLLFDRNGDLDMSLEPDFEVDMVKPGISLGLNFSFGMPFGQQNGLRAIEDLYRQQNRELKELRESHTSLTTQFESDHYRLDSLEKHMDSLGTVVKGPNAIPPHFQEIYARLLLYRSKYEQRAFDSEGLRKIQEEIFMFGEDAENALIHVVKIGDKNENIVRDCILMLGVMKSNKAVPILLDKLGEVKDRRLKVDIITALGSIGDRNTSYALKSLAQSNDEVVAMAAREVLLTWDSESGTPNETK